MNKSKAMILVLLPAYVLLSACGSQAPDPKSLPKRDSATVAKSSDQSAQSSGKSSSPVTPSAPADIAALEAKQDSLQTQKASLLAQQSDLKSQKQGFAEPSAMNPAGLGNLMVGAQALPAAIDQAKIDAIVTAAQNMDLDALKKAIEDLIADVQDAIADLQAQLDDLAAQIAAAKA